MCWQFIPQSILKDDRSLKQRTGKQYLDRPMCPLLPTVQVMKCVCVCVWGGGGIAVLASVGYMPAYILCVLCNVLEESFINIIVAALHDSL